MSDAPIGVFDSGLGGLTILRSLRTAFPHEDFVFVGDLAHLPYGDRSAVAIRRYSQRIVEWLVAEHGVKAVVVACNSASASAGYYLARRWGQKMPVINVIDPMVEHVLQRPSVRTVGVIGTRRTIRSGAYQRRFRKRRPEIRLKVRATPLLAPMVEEGFFNNTISRSIIRNYLPPEWVADLDVLVLGCTHYPLIRREIEEVVGAGLRVIDSTEIMPLVLRRYLAAGGLFSGRKARGKLRIFVTEWSDSFKGSLRLFMKDALTPRCVDLWGYRRSARTVKDSMYGILGRVSS